MFILFILGLVIGAVAIIFALQNIVPVSVVFLAWHFDGSLALILMLAVLAGAAVSALLTIPETIMNYFKFKTLQKHSEELEKKLQEDEKIILAQQVKEEQKQQVQEKSVDITTQQQ